MLMQLQVIEVAPLMLVGSCNLTWGSVFVVGLWLNIPDYDAPTQMVKPRERNVRYVNAVLTIPKVCLHPLAPSGIRS